MLSLLGLQMKSQVQPTLIPTQSFQLPTGMGPIFSRWECHGPIMESLSLLWIGRNRRRHCQETELRASRRLQQRLQVVQVLNKVPERERQEVLAAIVAKKTAVVSPFR